MADVGEHRLDRPEPSAVLIAALIAVDLALHACAGVVRFDPPDGDPRELALFGGILERDGIFKFISFSNGF